MAMLQMALRVGTKPHVRVQRRGWRDRPLNTLESLIKENASIHQEEAGMSVENTLKNCSTLQRDCAHAVGRNGSAPRVIANNQRDNVLGVVFHKNSLSEKDRLFSNLVPKKNIAHSFDGRRAIANSATEIHRFDGIFDKITGIIYNMTIRATVQQPSTRILSNSSQAPLPVETP